MLIYKKDNLFQVRIIGKKMKKMFISHASLVSRSYFNDACARLLYLPLLMPALSKPKHALIQGSATGSVLSTSLSKV